ncbi:Glycosyltransferase involved in cell wall bisynthesis [Virgibacillus subterraneus]|uniref:Glycosyltransferase involved in cell wall bisynthesis n=1 Tax=Virgibacillus subterraneus TaxID=621109 RepID=A0A1H9AHR2_9BACI|nr:glycosyltransferase [Virgibacillus subterraneus]SEP76250.1 Glycosyltransferase involved in cell wall bisynthesis [Virgibacillus subterraneus]
MKVFFITNMNVDNNKGGLFNATYERMKMHNKKLRQVIITNCNVGHSTLVRLIGKFIFSKKINKNPDIKKCEYNGIDIHNLNLKLDVFSYFKRHFLKQSLEDQIVKKYVARFDNYLKSSDAIHAHWGWPNGYVAYKLSNKYSIPYYITFHGSDINYLKEKSKKKMITVMENANKCFFVSEELYANALKIGYTGYNKAITYNGVDLDMFRINDHCKDSGKKVVGYVGSLEEKKGADYLVDIYRGIDKKKHSVEFVIVGDGSLSQCLEEEFKKKATDVNVKFTGGINPDEVPITMNQLDVLVVPSRNEGFGMVVLEANSCGVPVVGSNVGGLPEAIEYTKNIINMDNDFTHNMANRVVEILEGDSLTQEQYRERVKRKFSWDHITDFEIETYKSLPND